jgi:hypothetical protein
VSKILVDGCVQRCFSGEHRESQLSLYIGDEPQEASDSKHCNSPRASHSGALKLGMNQSWILVSAFHTVHLIRTLGYS